MFPLAPTTKLLVGAHLDRACAMVDMEMAGASDESDELTGMAGDGGDDPVDPGSPCMYPY